MNGLSNVIGTVCVALLNIVLLAMLIRAVMSLFTEDNVILNFTYSITEPIIIPVRKLIEKSNIMSGLPIDISFLITYMLLSMLRSVLDIWF